MDRLKLQPGDWPGTGPVWAHVGVVVGGVVGVVVGPVPSVKPQTCSVPTSLKAPHQLSWPTVLCSLRNAKLLPTVCSEPPGAVTKIEYRCAEMSTAIRKW